MLRLLLLGSLVFLTTAHVLPFDSATKCNVGKIKSCGSAFNKEIGYKGDPADYNAFVSYIYSHFLAKGRSGFDKFCSVISDTEKCYGPGLIDCLSVKNFMTIYGLDKQTAIDYAVFFHEMAYECGPGKKTFDDNYDCVVKTNEASRQHFEQCALTFQQKIAQDPQHFCKYAQVYLECLSEPFKVCSPAMEKAMCETVNAGFDVVFPCKNELTCDK